MATKTCKQCNKEITEEEIDQLAPILSERLGNVLAEITEKHGIPLAQRDQILAGARNDTEGVRAVTRAVRCCMACFEENDAGQPFEEFIVGTIDEMGGIRGLRETYGPDAPVLFEWEEMGSIE